MNADIKLPSNLFEVKVPTVALYTEAELELGGFAHTIINGESVNTNFSEESKVMLPLDRIIDIYINRFGIKVVKIDDVGKILDILEKYVNDIEAYNSVHRLNKQLIIDERLPEIKKFIKDIYNNNAAYIRARDAENSKPGFGIGASDMINSIMQVNKPVITSTMNNGINNPTNTHWSNSIGKTQQSNLTDKLGSDGPPIIHNVRRWPSRNQS